MAGAAMNVPKNVLWFEVLLYLSLVLGYVSGGQYVWSFWRQVVAKGL